MKIYKVKVTNEMIRRAEEKSQWHGDINNSIRRGKGNVVGYLGEEMALNFLSDVVEENNYDYDMVRFPDSPHTYTIDVKTKQRTVSPRDHYTVHVTTASLHQRVDTYVFAQVNKIEGGYEGWILGWMDKDEYLSKAKQVRKGDLDEYNKPETADAYKMPIKSINHF